MEQRSGLSSFRQTATICSVMSKRYWCTHHMTSNQNEGAGSGSVSIWYVLVKSDIALIGLAISPPCQNLEPPALEPPVPCGWRPYTMT